MPPCVLQNGKRVRVWNYEFVWTPDHRTPEELRPMLFTYDKLATECLDRFDELAASLPLRAKRKSDETGSVNPEPERAHPDLYQLLKDHAPEDETLQRLWLEVSTVPDWVDWAQIERGQKVFYRYAGPAIVGLTFQSLLGGMASARVVETLTRTGGFGAHVARRRLLETFRHVLAVTHSVDALRPPGGQGFAATVRVRLLHASVRRRILLNLTTTTARDRQKHHPGCCCCCCCSSYYDVARYGVPINDLHSLATALAFSAALVWIGLPRQGIRLREHEIADYLALWRYVAHLLGAPTSPLRTPRAARAAMESLLVAETTNPSRTSQVLANNMLSALAGQPPTYPSRDFLRTEARWLNGAELADALGLVAPRPAAAAAWYRCWYYAALVAGQCLFFMVVCYARRSVPAWDEAGIRRARRVLGRVAGEMMEGREAAYELGYGPDWGQVTATGGTGGEDGQEEGGKRWVLSGGVEERNLKVLFVALLAVGCVAWLGIRCASGLLRILW
ncbi:hypothetical protein VTK56DRAFT_8754 [Thermocarpiscus australiensis]